MKSMTGYGQSVKKNENLEISVEIHSINKKNLELLFNLPKEWQPMERLLSETVRKTIHRGKLSIVIKASTNHIPANTSSHWNYDPDTLNSILTTLKELTHIHEIKFDLNTDILLKAIKMAAKQEEQSASSLLNESQVTLLLEALNQAIEDLNNMKHTEGNALKSDIIKRVTLLKNILITIQEKSQDIPSIYRKNLIERLFQADLSIDLQDERILKEVALFADRCDISEECTRLYSHLNQFLKTLNSTEASGRKLDFLCQEIQREYNTIGSKANSTDITYLVVEAKNELEKIREQVQNVE